MINLGVIDILLLLVLLVTLALSIQRRRMAPFYVALALILLIEVERLFPGTMAAIGDGIHQIDVFNQRLPHIQIKPIITIQS
jgi:hypothetical protein